MADNINTTADNININVFNASQKYILEHSKFYIPMLYNFKRLIKLSITGIRNLDTIPIIPHTLVDLICTDNDFIELPAFPTKLEFILCYGNKLHSLPELPESLIHLDCSDNLLTELPQLPKYLKILRFSTNQISSIPALPPYITELDCDNNNITQLHTLPPLLNSLLCNNNNINILPTLPSELKILQCSNNKIQILPTLPDSLICLQCKANNLICLPPTLPTLKYILLNPVPFSLNCKPTQVGLNPQNVLIMPELPNTLYFIDFSINDDNKVEYYETSRGVYPDEILRINIQRVIQHHSHFIREFMVSRHHRTMSPARISRLLDSGYLALDRLSGWDEL